jgi:two-component system NtrC family sensor kinase
MKLNQKLVFFLALLAFAAGICIFHLATALPARIASLALSAGALVFLLAFERYTTTRLSGVLTNLHDLLNKNFNEILLELTDGRDISHPNAIQADKPSDALKSKDFASFMQYANTVFGKQITLFRRKNSQIKELNDKILFSKRQLEAVFDALNDGLCIVDHDMKILRLNQAFANHCGQNLMQLLGKKSHEQLPGTQKVNLDMHVKNTFDNGARVMDVRMESNTPEGKLYFVFASYPIYRDDRVEYVLEHYRNVTTEKKINDQLIRSANLATIGTMIIGIAHEMNKPLSAISGCALNMVNMSKNYGLNEKGRDRLKDILDCANRAENIFKGLLDLSRKRESQFIIMDILPVIDKSTKSIHIKGYADITKTLEVESGLHPVVNCDPNRVTQVFINLLTNATFSLLEKQEKEATGKGKGGYAPEIRIFVQKDINDIIVKVADNGMGIPPDKMPFIFDPFYTTRPPGQGTGLGLSICSKIMLEHNGRISVESDEGKTTFILEFPLSNTV